MSVTTIMTLPTEMCMEIVLQLPPRHVYKLMQTNKKFRKLCSSEKYWRRVALYVVWGNGDWHDHLNDIVPERMMFLSKSYKATMDDFIGLFRDLLEEGCQDLRGHELPRNPAAATAPLKALLEWVQKNDRYERITRPYVYGETAFQLCRRYVEPDDELAGAIQRAKDKMEIPAPGFMSGSKYADKLSREFLYVLDDDVSMSLASKNRIRDATQHLLDSIQPVGDQVMIGTEMYHEVITEKIDAAEIYLY